MSTTPRCCEQQPHAAVTVRWDFEVSLRKSAGHRITGVCRVRVGGAKALIARMNLRYGAGSHWIEEEERVDG